MRIAVIDGQGGGIGKHIIEKLRSKLSIENEILALGTNALATSAMLKAGANEGATGESAIVFNSDKVDIIIGPIAIVLAYSMLGELTPKMAEAVAKSPARKILIPLNRNNVEIVGVKNEPLPHLVDYIIEELKIMEDDKNV
ncbi:hypothetical protein OXPF_05400 [Oxobacter pfennigii]|uniref:DUF3842 family protein n=1 Tax=Oxobacter pfennigii TaxID=36849 RepID=A0A0P8YG97_9CLOT|nr:DUF3842 family protein [Oxobacter pfennigii]KPU46059.1 hypothetical protein OXPF_05400 [Oxobacter pfennigii]